MWGVLDSFIQTDVKNFIENQKCTVSIAQILRNSALCV